MTQLVDTREQLLTEFIEDSKLTDQETEDAITKLFACVSLTIRRVGWSNSSTSIKRITNLVINAITIITITTITHDCPEQGTPIIIIITITIIIAPASPVKGVPLLLHRRWGTEEPEELKRNSNLWFLFSVNCSVDSEDGDDDDDLLSLLCTILWILNKSNHCRRQLLLVLGKAECHFIHHHH